jgi:hypothetical protein
MYVSAPADTLFESTYRVTGPGNFGWASKEGTHCFDRTSAFAPPRTCAGVGPLGEPIQDPIIEYLNFAVEDPRSQFPGRGFGRASLGGHIYRGKTIKWLTVRLTPGLDPHVHPHEPVIRAREGERPHEREQRTRV